MSFSEAALMVGLIVLVFGGGYGLLLKYRIEHAHEDEDSTLTAPPAE
ncbi:MAG: hypothetical protein K9G59_16075 [Caulobacter sp.]|nr:hypothetical protein [Caulobacter sp.]